MLTINRSRLRFRESRAFPDSRNRKRVGEMLHLYELNRKWIDPLPWIKIVLLAHQYPMLLDLSDRTAVIVGGGAVAARKARGLVDAGAGRVRCVAPQFAPQLPEQVERVSDRYRASHLDGAELVFAATDDPEVNDAVVRDARSRNLLVNRADRDDQEPGDFATPAVLRRGAVTVAVSAGSPALSAAIRDALAGQFDPRWEQMADAMRDLRPLIQSAPLDAVTRRAVFHELAGPEAFEILARDGFDALRRWLVERHPELHDA